MRFHKNIFYSEIYPLGFSEIEKCIDFLHTAPYFDGDDMDMQDVVNLAMKSQVVNFHSKEIAVRPEVRSKYVYFILNGRFQVIAKLAGGTFI